MPMTRLPPEIRPVLENGTPAVMVTCSADGKPNTTVISQVYYVDETHAALSFQFFSKTIRNVRENPRAFVCVFDIAGQAHWALQLEFERSETEGPIFDAMDMQIEAIASMTGMSGIFKLRAADIYRVLSVERVQHPMPTMDGCQASSSSTETSTWSNQDSHRKVRNSPGRPRRSRSCSACPPTSIPRSTSTRSATSRCGRWTSCSSFTTRTSSCSSPTTRR